jgi:hypothetical protein
VPPMRSLGRGRRFREPIAPRSTGAAAVIAWSGKERAGPRRRALSGGRTSPQAVYTTVVAARRQCGKGRARLLHDTGCGATATAPAGQES